MHETYICKYVKFTINRIKDECVILSVRTFQSDSSVEEKRSENISCLIFALTASIRGQTIQLHNSSLDRLDVLDSELIGNELAKLITTRSALRIIDYISIQTIFNVTELRVLMNLFQHPGVMERAKQLSININVCLAMDQHTTIMYALFNAQYFQGLLDVIHYLRSLNILLFDVENDPETFFYNHVLKEKTACASRFTWLNEMFLLKNTSANTT